MSAREWLVLIGLSVAWIGYYATACWWFPFRRCWCCSGTGRHHSKNGKHLRLCRWCTGSGRRVRLARRGWNLLRRHQ